MFKLLVIAAIISVSLANKVIFQDDFNGGLDQWNPITGHPHNQELQYLTPNQNVKLEGGFLKMIGRKEHREGKQYTSAKIISKRGFKYGIFEARAKVPTGKGMWPAFWLLGNQQRAGQWPKCGEIDIMEYWGCKKPEVWGTIHTEKYNHMKGNDKHGTHPIDVNVFHTYKLDWNSKRIQWFVDNVKYFEYVKSENSHDAWPFDAEMNIILNLALGGNIGCPNMVDESRLPAEFIVDYVKVYEPSP